MWKDILQEFNEKLTFLPPATEDEIADVESSLGVKIPQELQGLLSETNGIKGQYGLGVIWSAKRIKETNQKFRTNPVFRENYQPFDSLLFFADAGNGDQFAYTIKDGEIADNVIYVWNHENDSRKKVAASLQDYLEAWLSKRLKI